MASGTADSSNGFRIELLGPVEARVDGRAVALGGQRPRALFAVLALMAGRVVTIEQLIDELWGEEPPARARDSLQMHVSRLRKGLAEAGADGGRLVSHAGGYLLEVRPGERDVDRWQQALNRARLARAGGEPRVAREGVEEALGVWRGQPLGGVSTNSLLDAERARLEEDRLAAVIEGIELDLELGRHGELLGQLEALIIAHPFKERLVELQMLALYRCGRQADALAAFQAARRRFVDELGIEPARPLRELHDDILKHSPELSSPIDTTLEAQPRPAKRRAFGDRVLPVPPNRTIGREQDLGTIGERLHAGSVRLLTLTGPGGVGKTRLAVEAARAVQADFADGAHFVSLAAVQRPDDVPAAIVKALGIIVLSGEPPEQAVERFLAAKHLLLVVDNLEHVLAAASFVGELLGACPALTVLATSRESLGLQAEVRYPVSPLALPEPNALDDPEALAGVDAVALFRERARSRDPAFRLSDANAVAVAEICRRVDGLPLAIELAAARCALLSPGEIAERLQAALGALGAGARDAPARQQTLRATIDWSHDLLNDAEKQCFARFAVFAGGATVRAAETITGTDLQTLDRLVAKSLLVRRQHADGPARLHMLETVRAYATERLAAAPDRDAVHARHFEFCLALAQHHGSQPALFGADNNEHLTQLDAENANLHVGLRWAIDASNAEQALTMVVALGWYWLNRVRHADAVRWIDQALSVPGADAHPALRVRALCVKAMCMWPIGRGAEQAHIMAEAEAIARTLGDPLVLSQTLQTRADREATEGRLEAADALADEALHWARVAGDDWQVAFSSRGKAMAASNLTDLRMRVDIAASLLEEAGNLYQLAGVLASAAYGALCLHGDNDAKAFISRALPIARELDSLYLWMLVHGNAGLAELLTGDTDAARRAFRAELDLARETVVLPFASEGLLGLAAVAAANADVHRAARLAGAAAAHRHGDQQKVIVARLESAFFQPARERCGTDAWQAVARDGASLSLEHAIAYALEEPARTANA